MRAKETRAKPSLVAIPVAAAATAIAAAALTAEATAAVAVAVVAVAEATTWTLAQETLGNQSLAAVPTAVPSLMTAESRTKTRVAEHVSIRQGVAPPGFAPKAKLASSTYACVTEGQSVVVTLVSLRVTAATTRIAPLPRIVTMGPAFALRTRTNAETYARAIRLPRHAENRAPHATLRSAVAYPATESNARHPARAAGDRARANV
jgi:hypothetical protein